MLSSIPFFTSDIDPGNFAYDNAQMAAAICQFRDYSSGNPASPYAEFGPYRSIFDVMKITGGPSYTGQSDSLWKFYQEIWALNPQYVGNDTFTTTSLSPGEATNEAGVLSPFAPTFKPLRQLLGSEIPVYQPPPPPTSTPPVAYPVPMPLWTECDPTDHVFGDVKSRFLGFTRISNLITTRSDSFTVYVQVQAWQNVGTSTPALAATKRAGLVFDRSQVKPVRIGSGSNVTLTPPSVVNFPND